MTCAKCKQFFDLLCANYTEDVYATFSLEYKMSWICVECRSKVPKGDNSSTPVRQHHIQDTSIASDSPGVSICSPEHVTVRTGTRYGQPTGKNVNDDMSNLLKALQVSLVNELSVVQDELEKRLITKFSKLLTEHFCAFKSDLLEKVNRLSKRMDELERSINTLTTGINRSETIMTPIPTEINKTRQATEPAQRKNKKKQTSLQKSNSASATIGSGGAPPRPPPARVGNLNRNDKPDQEGWTEVIRRRPSSPARASLPGVMRGTAAPGTTILCAAERKAFLHLYYVKEGTTVEQVNAHLKTICGADVCFVEALKARGDYASFKLTVPPELTNLLLNPDNWAVNICVKPWRHIFRNKQEK